MNMRLFGKAILYAGAILLFGAMALAQSTKGTNPPPSKKDAPNAQPAGRKSGAVIAADFKGSGQASTDREGGGPIISEVTATDKANGQAAAFPSFKSMGSAHATESLATAPPQGKNELDQLYDRKANPHTALREHEGVNPLFEAKDKDAVAPPSKSASLEHSHETVEYKDPEDMTTRYRPGNNKTTKDSKPPSSGTSSKQ
ncbi:MAG: hypothetical protein WCA11_15125 [Terracidiphilus sp.]